MKALFQIAIVSAMAVFLCSCAAMTVRSGQRPSNETIYGATQTDLDILWESGIKGQPIFYGIPPNQEGNVEPPKAGFFSRFLISLGSLIDLPMSLVSDTVFLPFDLFLPPQTDKAEE